MEVMKKPGLLAALACLCIIFGALLNGCGGSEDATDASGDESEPVSREFFAMDTYMTVTAYGDHAAEATAAAEEEVYRLDEMLSTGNPDSEISRLNEAGGGVLSEEAGGLVERGLQMYGDTDGLFDIAIYPVMDAWGFTDQNYKVPSEGKLEKLLPLTDAGEISCGKADDGVEIGFGKKGMAIDLGGIAKGYTSSRIMDIYRDYGVTSGMVSLGGNVQVLGTKPDGSLWRVAVQDPGEKEASEDEGGDDAEDDAEAPVYMGVLEAQDTAIITSGAYERNFTRDGKRYHHIIDPATGKPADSGLRSVTIVSGDGTLADALSTSLYIMGKDEALDYWRSHADQFDYILLDEDDEIYITKPIADQFSSDVYHINVVE